MKEQQVNMNQITTIEEAVKRLKQDGHLPLRVILQEKDGAYEGEVEHSFSLSWSHNLVNIYWSGKAYSNLGSTHQLDAIRNSASNLKRYAGQPIAVYDPLSPDCPVDVDLVIWVNHFYDPRASKFQKRNAPMKQRDKQPHVKLQPQACPFCGHKHLVYCVDWKARSADPSDSENEALLEEWQCRNEECGLSIWI